MDTFNGTLTFPCGPTTMTVTDLGSGYGSAYASSIATQIYACGKVEQRLSKTLSSGPRRISFKLVQALLLMMGFFACTVLASDLVDKEGVIKISLEGFAGDVFNVTGETSFTDELLIELALANALAVIDSESGHFFEIQKVETRLDEENGGIEKRDCFPTGDVVTVTEWQTAQSGTWWSPWYPVSCCHYCDDGPSLCTAGVGYSFSYSWSVSGGVTLASISASTSFTLTRESSYDTSFSCTWSGGSGPAQIWYQHQIYWADMQLRTRVVGSNCWYAEPWSQYYRANVPIKNSVHFGCSVGWGNTQCEDGHKCVLV